MAVAAVFWQVVPNNNCLSRTHLARAGPPVASAPRRMAASDILPVANRSGLAADAAPRPYARGILRHRPIRPVVPKPEEALAFVVAGLGGPAHQRREYRLAGLPPRQLFARVGLASATVLALAIEAIVGWSRLA
jgi:hypothetical protein